MKKLLLFIALTIFGLGLNAQSITIDYDGYSLEFSIISPAECKVSDCTGSPTEVTIPSTVTISGTEFAVTSIGRHAFYDCSSLTSVTFGENSQLISIGRNAFSDCSSLTSVTFGENSQLTSIGEWAFEECSSLTSIEIPNSVTSIGDEAFSSCSSLTSITFGENSQLTSIGAWVFSNCLSLTSIEIPNSVTSIGALAFYYCASLTSIEIPNSVTYIGDGAFEYCSSLTSIVVAEGNTVYDSRENCNAIIETSSNTLIAGCQNTVIPNSVTSIGGEAFFDCDGLTSIEIPNSVTSIGYGAFWYCSSLTSIEIPNSVISIDWWAFSGCSSLTSIELPNSVTSIGVGAFSECSSLRVIKCYAESVPETGDDIFGSCPSDMIIYVPENSVEDYKETSPWNAFTILSLNEGPRNITATTESVSSIILTWDNVKNAESYNIYRDGDSIANVTNPTYTDICLEYNTEYCYTVTAVRNETESYKSEEWCAKTFDLPIKTPENLVTEALSTSSIKLTWDGVENALSYNVYQSNELIANVEDTTFTVDGLEYNTEYCYTVTAVRNETETDKSEEWCTKTFDLPITTPEVYGEAIDEHSIMLSWNPVENALSYNVYGLGTVTNITETTYILEGLEPNTDYCFEVSSVRNNTEVRTPYEICVMTFDLPITTPENLVATAISTSEITLTWNEVENALSYNIYRDNEFIANVTENNYSVNNLDYYTEYCFTVTAVRNEQESENSNSDCAKTFDLPISTPENLVATAISTSEISLTWDEVENALSYNVYQANELIANIEETTFTVDGLEYNTEYCYTVTAVRNETESYKSEEKCAKTFDLPITTPENLVAEALSTSSISLSWNEVENALSYNVYQANELIANIEETTFTVDGLEYNTEYCYTVTAVRNETESYKSEEKCAKTFDLPITTPENLIANVLSTSSIILTWDNVENALSYNVYRDGKMIINVTNTNYTDNNLEYNTEYCYTVTAVRNETESDKSEEKCAKTFDLPITTPENLIANVLSTSSIILTWDNVENALSYNVYRDGEMIINVTNTNYTDNNLEYNTEYCYTVTAVRGDKESEKSSAACATTMKADDDGSGDGSDDGNDDGNDNPTDTIVPEPEVLAVPENLVATAESSSSISLSWDEVENAESYNVYRDGDSIANVTNPTYTDKDLEYNTEYCYTVTAVGDDDEESEESEEVCVKTLGESIEELSSSINIYPNPVENELFLATEMNVKEVAIYDVYGRLCRRDALNASTSNSMDTFNVSVQDLEAGVYFVNIKTENGNVVKRFVKN